MRFGRATFVGDAVLKDSIRQLREALQDDAASPSYIETAHRRGYRFIAKLLSAVIGSAPVEATGGDSRCSRSPNTVVLSSSGGHRFDFSVRDAELAKLRSWLHRALNGRAPDRLYHTGKPESERPLWCRAFWNRLRNFRRQSAWHADNAWSTLAQAKLSAGARRVLPTLPDRRGWPSLGTVAEHAPPGWRRCLTCFPGGRNTCHLSRGATRERMLREMAEAIETLTADLPCCWFWRTCTGATTRRSTWFPIWHDGRSGASDGHRHLSARRCDSGRPSA